MRKINKIIVHCTATPEGREHDVEEIRRWHKKRGWSDIGYHWLIRIDGMIRPGRPETRMGAHCKNHNADSIGLVYVGGMDTDMNPKNTMNPEQETAMVNLIQSLQEKYPGATVHGHNEFSSKACPSFDVQEVFGFLNK